MKKIFLFASALAGLFLAASCQQENLEPVAEGGVTYTISLPDGPQTKGENGYQMYDLYYEVYRTVDAVELATATPLFEKKVVMNGNSTTVYLELLNDQDYTVLFWANKQDEAYFNTADLRNVEMVQAASNNDDRDAFCGMDQIVNINSAYTKTVELKRPFAQINIATLVSTTAGYDVTPTASLVKVSDIPVAYNVATAQPVGTEGEVTYTKNLIPGGTITYGTESYTNVAMNYVLVPESNVTVYYEIETANGTVTNEIPNVPVKANYRTNIIGNLLTSDATYTVKVEPLFAGVEAEIELVNTAAALQEAIENAQVGAEIVLDGDINLSDLFDQLTKSSVQSTDFVTVPAGKEVILNLNGYSITGVDETEKNFGLIQNNGKLTVKNDDETASKISLVAKYNSGWNRYSAVISNNPGAELTVEGNVVIEHLGGTDMAYGIDALTNGTIGAVKTTIDGATVTSTYRAVRQFLNSASTDNELLIMSGSTIRGAENNKAVFFHDPSANANKGKLTIEEGASVSGVYLYVAEGSTEWPVEVSIAASSIAAGYEVVPANVPAHLMVANVDGIWTVVPSFVETESELTVHTAGALTLFAQRVNAGETFEGKTVKLGADIDLKNIEWTPIGSVTQEHGFMGNFDGNGYTIKNLKMTQLAADADNYVYAGLFGVTEGAENQENSIKNLVIENVTIETSGHIVAAAVAYPYYTTLENITVKGDINIKGGDYTSGVLAYTRRCVNAKNIAIVGNANSVVEGNKTVGGVISDIQMNGGLKANYSNFSASGLTIKGLMHVGGISGIICLQTLNGAIVENVAIVSDDVRKGALVGSLGDDSVINGASVNNVTGAANWVGATYKNGSTCSVTINGVVYEYLENGKIEDANGYEIVANGLGYKDKTYAISSAEGLVAMSNITIKGGESVILTADIDLAGVEFNGLNAFNPEPNNTFDGQGHTVSNWTYTGGVADMAFIKNWVGTIKNVTIEGASLKTAGRSAVLAAKVYANIENCHVVDSRIEDSYWACGVIAGLYNDGDITNCSVDGCYVQSNGGVGGIVGVINETSGERKIEGCAVKNTTVNNTGVYGESYSGALVAGLINVENATIKFNNCTLENNTKEGNYVGDLFYSAEGNNVFVDGVQQ